MHCFTVLFNLFLHSWTVTNSDSHVACLYVCLCMYVHSYTHRAGDNRPDWRGFHHVFLSRCSTITSIQQNAVLLRNTTAKSGKYHSWCTICCTSACTCTFLQYNSIPLYVFVFQLWLGCSRLGNILVYDLNLFTLQQSIAVDSAGISYMCHIKNQVNNVD